MAESRRIQHYDLLRVILVIAVVLSHSVYYNIDTHFGGIYYYDFMVKNGIVNPTFYKCASILTEFLYSFHMPVFIALSGSLYALSKEKSFTVLVGQKFRRLIIPFVVVWIFWNIPIKFISGYYNDVGFAEMIKQLIFPASVYLWYLEALFFVFILFFWIKKLSPQCALCTSLLVWAVGVYLTVNFADYQFLGNPLYYVLWFYLGFKIETIIDIFKRYRLWNILAILGLLVIDLLLFLYNRTNPIFVWRLIIKHTFLPFNMLIILNYFVRYVSLSGKVVRKLSKYSFGIYLYAEPLNYLFLSLFFKMFGIGFFGSNLGAITIYITRIVGSSLIAVLITNILTRLNVKYIV